MKEVKLRELFENIGEEVQKSDGSHEVCNLFKTLNKEEFWRNYAVDQMYFLNLLGPSQMLAFMALFLTIGYQARQTEELEELMEK